MYIILLSVFWFALGAIVGSFLNVLALRLHTGRSVGGRSACFSCATVLSWYELIPVISFVVQRGRCRSCSVRLAIQYPLVELCTGILFAATAFMFSSGTPVFVSVLKTGFFAIVVSLLVAILVYDLRHKIIPNVFVYTLGVLAFISLFVSFDSLSVTIPTLWQLLSGPILAAPLAFLWLISRGAWMGLGDAKLVLSLGWLLGLRAGFSALIWAFWLGALISILILSIQHIHTAYTHNRKLLSGESAFTMKSEVPFAPFLILGFLLVFFFGQHVDVLKLLGA